MTKKTATLLLVILALAAIFALAACHTHTCTFGEWTVVKEATCTEDGLKERVCTDPDCNEKETETIPAAHKLTDVEAEPASCETDGHTAYKLCEVCNKKFDANGNELTGSEVIPAAHKLTDVAAKSATCDTDGNIAYKLCEVCGKKFDADNHELTDAQVLEPAHHTITTIALVPASDHVGGTVAYNHCMVCLKDFDVDTGAELQNLTIPPLHADYDKDTLYCATCDKYVILDAAQLAKFRDSVNGSTDYNGKTVVLDANVDLANAEWEPINGFKGIFDGQNHTITNLKITSGNDAVGLFGDLWKCAAIIKNFTLDGVNIVGGENVGAVVGLTASTTVTNVTVRNAVITSAHFAGGIVGYGYCNIDDCTVENLTITCVPNGTVGNYDNGDKVGGIVGYLASGTADNCTVTNAKLKGYRDIGGIAGILLKDGVDPDVKNCTVNGVDITIDQVTNSYGAKAMNPGGIVGRLDTTVATLEGNNAEDVTYKFIVDPASAQNALDAAKPNSTILLAAGEYNQLLLRQSKFVSQDLSDPYPKYSRSVENLTIIGVDGVVVKGFVVLAGHIYSADGNTYNPVTGAQHNYYSTINVKNFTVRGVKFTDVMEFNGWESTMQSGDGLIIENCEFDMADSAAARFEQGRTQGTSALHFGASKGMRIWTNVTVDGCTFKNAFQGIYIVNAENLTVQNCAFDTINHNAVAVQSTDGDTSKGSVGGNIVISDNTFANGGNRAFRFGIVGADAVITIGGNTITNYSDTDGEILKTQATTVGATLTFTGNTYGGANLENRTITCDGNPIILTNAVQAA